MTREYTDEVNPDTLCRHWKHGCNGVTNGRGPDGRLTLCDECSDEPHKLADSIDAAHAAIRKAKGE